MKASPSEAILIRSASNSAATDTVVLSCSDSLAVGGEIAWHRGGALYLPRGRKTQASDQAVAKMRSWSLLA